jgi:hypothetical protein
MSEKLNYEITIDLYGPDSWFDPNKVAASGGFGAEDVYETFVFTFSGTKEEMESFVIDKLNEIDDACGGRGSLNYELYVDEV